MKELEENAKLKRDVKRLKERIAALESETKALRTDRDSYRSWCLKHFKWQTELIAENKVANVKSVVEDMAKLFNRCEYFYWG